MSDPGAKMDQYQKGDRVFAKLKGYPPWPAQVQERVAGREEKYYLHFYGTHDSAHVKVQSMYPYNEKTIAKHGRPAKPSPTFKKAMEEIEANLELYETADALEPVEDEIDEGDLQIDETPPPVLKREGKITAPRSAPKEPVTKPARRLSKSTKRDSVTISSAFGNSSPVIETPPPPPAPQPEIISRSGRKIKPKRFADDEIGSPVSILAKAALQSSFEEAKVEPSPSAPKRSKKQKGNGAASPAPAPLLTPEQPAPPAKPKETPELKTRGKVTRGTPKLQPIEQVASPPVIATKSKVSLPPPHPVPDEPVESPELSAEVEPENTVGSLPTKDEVEEPTEDAPEEETRDEIEDKENSTSSWVNTTQDEDNVSEDSSSSKTELKHFTDIPVNTDDGSAESIKIPLAVKKDTEVEIIYNHDKPKEFPSQKARIEWDMATAKNVLKVRETLESIEPAAVELFNLLAAAVEQKESELMDIMQKALSEKRALKLRKLRVEGEVIEIIGDIINCLSAGAADCDRAIELLERLRNHDLSALILKKHPEIVETVRKLRFYEGNAEEWDLSPEQTEEFDDKTAVIREKACKIYESFKATFGSTPDKSFEKDYAEELERFKEYCARLSPKDFLNMTEEPSSEASVGGDGVTAEDADPEEGLNEEVEEADDVNNGGSGSMSEGDLDDSTQDVGDEDTPCENDVEMESEQDDTSRNNSDMVESETDG